MLLKEQKVTMLGDTYNYNTERFNSISELVNFLKTTEVNEPFKNSVKSRMGSYYFTGTYTYEEAEQLLINGWEEESIKLAEKLKKVNINKDLIHKMTYDVVGFQPSVPRYLQGIPQNMFNNKKINIKKSKIIDVYKAVSYPGYVSTETIKEESLKALKIVQLLENEGYKCNLYVCDDLRSGITKAVSVQLKIKNASDRLNLSKVTFPLIHPSFLRRFVFAWIERSKLTNTKAISAGYGSPITGYMYKDFSKELKKLDFYKNALFIPSIFDDTAEEFIKNEFQGIK